MEWAAKSGIFNGYDNGKFGSNDNITREQVAAIIHRFLEGCSPGISHPLSTPPAGAYRRGCVFSWKNPQRSCVIREIIV